MEIHHHQKPPPFGRISLELFPFASKKHIQYFSTQLCGDYKKTILRIPIKQPVQLFKSPLNKTISQKSLSAKYFPNPNPQTQPQFDVCINLFLDPLRGAKWMGKGAIKQPLRVQTPPIGGCWYTHIHLLFHLFFLRRRRFFLPTNQLANKKSTGVFLRSVRRSVQDTFPWNSSRLGLSATCLLFMVRSLGSCQSSAAV